MDTTFSDTAARTLDIRSFNGDAVEAYLDDIARLRIAVFRDWPYLYDGDAGYESEYLQTYLRSPRSIVVLAFDGDRVVGASTGLPLVDESEAFLAPFEDTSLNPHAVDPHAVDPRAADPRAVFYCGESVLLPQYRGRGIGHRFFDERQAHARRFGDYAWTAFCAVDRDDHDPRRPPSHHGNEAFWRKRGYRPWPRLRASLPWREVGRGEVPHTLTFWLRPLERMQ